MSPCKWEGPASHDLSVLEGSGLGNVFIAAKPAISFPPVLICQKVRLVSSCGDSGEPFLLSQPPTQNAARSVLEPLLALVDSGADENFLDINIAAQAGIPSEVLDSPLNANALNVCPTACRDRHSTTQDRAA
ncbi:hypothetical protein NQZ68_023815 [Dissostichus eleginoides]|nr:hypothetical protein NQZ68_023815 [Dissostichus eleginoides]